MSKPRQVQQAADEDALWADRLGVLKAGIRQGRQGYKRQAEQALREARRELATQNRRRQLAQERAEEVAAVLAIVEEDRSALLKEQREIIAAERLLSARAEVLASRAAEMKSLIASFRTPDAPNDNLPTPEVTARAARVDPLLTLEQWGDAGRSDGITRAQALAGYKLRRIMEAISRAGQAKTSRLESSGGAVGGWREADLADGVVALYHDCFLPWLSEVGVKSDTAYVVEKIAIRGMAIRPVARKLKRSDDKTIELLRGGLDAFDAKWRATRSTLEAVHQTPPVEA